MTHCTNCENAIDDSNLQATSYLLKMCYSCRSTIYLLHNKCGNYAMDGEKVCLFCDKMGLFTNSKNSDTAFQEPKVLDWKTWRDIVRPADYCACGINRNQCVYHK